jgi:hypothetical protein
LEIICREVRALVVLKSQIHQFRIGSGEHFSPSALFTILLIACNCLDCYHWLLLNTDEVGLILDLAFRLLRVGLVTLEKIFEVVARWRLLSLLLHASCFAYHARRVKKLEVLRYLRVEVVLVSERLPQVEQAEELLVVFALS